MGHTATYDPTLRCIYVFGGSKNTRWFHDVHILDIDEWKWQLVKVRNLSFCSKNGEQKCFICKTAYFISSLCVFSWFNMGGVRKLKIST